MGKVKPIDDLLNDWAHGFVFSPNLTLPSPKPSEEEQEVRVLVANDSSLRPSEKQLIFEQLAPKDVELMDHALEDEHRMKVFALKSKKCWDDIFLAKDNAAFEEFTEEDIHQDVSGVEIPTHFRHDLPLSSKLAFCKHDQENIPTSEMRMICKDPQLTKFVDEPVRLSALKNSKFWWLWNIAMNSRSAN